MKFLENSNWIWSPSWNDEDKKTPGIMLFRKEVKLTQDPEKAAIEISADTRYKLYVNEQLVEIGPSKGDKSIWYKDTVDLTDYLKKGRNIIAVKVLRYPEAPMDGNHGMFRTATPGLYVKGQMECTDGTVHALVADETWKCRKDQSVAFVREEERFAPLIIHEKAYGNRETSGWMKPEYDASDWENARPYINVEIHQAVSPGNLHKRTIPYMYRKKRTFKKLMAVTESVHSETEWNQFISNQPDSKNMSSDDSVSINDVLEIPANSREIVEIDAGEEMTGYISAAFLGGKEARIELIYTESYVMDEHVGPDNVALKGDRLDQVNGHLEGYEDQYRVGGYGEKSQPEIYEPFWFRTFRFVKLCITTKEEPLTLQRLDYEETGYPLEVSTQVETSDESLKAIWDISERTLRRCMHETYEDCPYYEQLQYIMDSRTQILYTYAVSADDRLARKCIDDLSRAQRYDGLLNCSYPNCNPNIIPGFSIYYILMIYDHMMYFGDKKLVETYMPTVERILAFFDEHLSEKGYVGKTGGLIMEEAFWSFIDWAKEWNPTSGMPPAGLKGPVTMESLLYIYGLQHAAKLAEYLGRKDQAGQFAERAGKVQEAIRKYCMNPEGMIMDGPGVEEYSQHCQVFACLTDTVSKEIAKKNILKTIKEPGYVQCTVAMRFYLFRALEKTGLYEYTDQYWDTWRKMVENHCTTCVESEDYARSECHAWGALALYELPQTVLGVRPAAPGYEKIKIAAITVALGVLATGCGGSGSSGSDSKTSDGNKTVTVKAGTGANVKPYTYVGEDNETTGYDVEVLKEVFERLDGYDLQLELTDIPSVFSGVTSGTYQIGVNNFSYNEERAKSYLYSYPYDKIGYVFITKKGAPEVKTFADAAGKSFEGQSGVSVTTAIESWNEKNPDKKIDITYTDADTAITLQHIADGSTDLAIIDVAMYNAYQKEYNYDVVANQISDEDAKAIADNSYAYYIFPKDQKDLRDKVDEQLKELKKDGTLTELSQKYFGQDTAPEDDQFESTPN